MKLKEKLAATVHNFLKREAGVRIQRNQIGIEEFGQFKHLPCQERRPVPARVFHPDLPGSASSEMYFRRVDLKVMAIKAPRRDRLGRLSLQWVTRILATPMDSSYEYKKGAREALLKACAKNCDGSQCIAEIVAARKRKKAS